MGSRLSRGIERLSGLDTLMLGDNAVVDIGPLAGLTRLQVLDLSNNEIADLVTASQSPCY